MLNEDMRNKYIENSKKVEKLQKEINIYKENYNDIDINCLHETNRKLVLMLYHL